MVYLILRGLFIALLNFRTDMLSDALIVIA